MRILITGAAGFIGSHLVKRLAPEHELFALVRRHPPLPHAGVQYIQQDLSQPLDRRQLPSEVDAIIHQAAVIRAEAAQDDAIPFLVNVVATWRLLEYAASAKVHTFIHASTGGVYGSSDQPLRESDLFKPMNLYSLTKAQAELAVQSSLGSFHKIVLRYFFPYGDGTPNPIPTYVKRAVLGEPIEVLQSRKPMLNPLHISDAVEATIQCLYLEVNEIINIAGTEVTTFAEIAEIAAQTVGRQPVFQYIPDDRAIPYYRSHLVASIDHMQATLRITPNISLREGIAQLAYHYGRLKSAS